MKPLTTTLNAIRARDPCKDSWEKLLSKLGKTKADAKPLLFSTILKHNGLDDALWACRAAPQYDKTWRLLAVRYAREVQHLMTDPRSLAALDVAERHAHGKATDEELEAAGDAAGDAAGAAGAAAEAAARAAAWAAWVAAWAAWAAAGDAARRKQTAIAKIVFAGKPVPKFRSKKT